MCSARSNAVPANRHRFLFNLARFGGRVCSVLPARNDPVTSLACHRVSRSLLPGPLLRLVKDVENGFIPIDVHSKVRGVEHVYAAGDATNFAVKHGGIAAEQADAAAEAITALAGIPIDPKPFDPVIHGMLLTGAEPKYLTAHIAGGHDFSSTVSDTATWSPPSKIAARYLAPYLEQLDRRAVGAGSAREG